MTTLSIISLIYFIVLLICLLWIIYRFCKIYTFMRFPYPLSSISHHSSLPKLLNSQWSRFLMQINKSSFDSEELNSMHKKNEMIFKKWIILLIQQYHPAGFLWNRIINGKKKSNTIASKITLLLFICTHLIIASLFSLIADTYEMKMSSWMALTIPFGIAIFIISFGVIFIIRYFMLKNVNCVITKMEDQLGTEQINKGNDFSTDLKGILILNKNSEMVHKNENTEQLYHDQISYSTSRNQLSLSNMILSGCILILIILVGL